MGRIEKWEFVDKYLAPLVQAIDTDVASVTPVADIDGDVTEVLVTYNTHRTTRINVACDSLAAITTDVLRIFK